MKKLVCALFLLAIASIFPVCAYAEGTIVYSVSDLEMTVSLPSDMFVYSRDNYEATARQAGLKPSYLLSLLESDNIYLYALPTYGDYEVVIRMFNNSDTAYLFDFDEYSEAQLEELVNDGNFSHIAGDANYYDGTVYYSPECNYISVRRTDYDGGTTTYYHQYFTVVKGRLIEVMLYNENGAISSDMDSLLKSAVASISFTGSSAPVTLAQTETAYADSTNGISFTVPAGWGQKSTSSVNGGSTVKYIDNQGDSIIFWCADVPVSALSEAKQSYTAENICNDGFSRDEIGAMFSSEAEAIDGSYGATVDGVYLSTDNDVEYFELIRYVSNAVGTINSPTYVMLNNGKMYAFKYVGDIESASFSDIYTTLDSVSYSFLPKDSSAAKLRSLFKLPINATDTRVALSALLTALITLVPYLLVFIILRYAVGKEPYAKKKALIITSAVSVLALIAAGIVGFNYVGGIAEGTAILIFVYPAYRLLVGGKPKPAPLPESFAMAGTAPWVSYTPVDVIASEQEPLPSPLFCTECGAPLKPNTAFCGKCGFGIR